MFLSFIILLITSTIAQDTLTSGGSGVSLVNSGTEPSFTLNALNVGSGGLSIGLSGADITLDNTLTGTNLGSGTALFADKSGATLEFNSLGAGANVALSSSSGTVTVSVASNPAFGNVGLGATTLSAPGGTARTLTLDDAGADAHVVLNTAESLAIGNAASAGTVLTGVSAGVAQWAQPLAFVQNTGNAQLGVGAGALAAGAGSGSVTAVGVNAGGMLAGGFGDNTLVGDKAGFGLTIGSENTYIGSLAGQGVSGSVSDNTVVGALACGNTAPSGSYNTIVGAQTAEQITTAADSSFFGFQSGASVTSANCNSLYGYQTNVLGGGSSNSVFGSGAKATGSNGIALGAKASAAGSTLAINLSGTTTMTFTSTLTPNTKTAVSLASATKSFSVVMNGVTYYIPLYSAQ